MWQACSSSIKRAKFHGRFGVKQGPRQMLGQVPKTYVHHPDAQGSYHAGRRKRCEADDGQ